MVLAMNLATGANNPTRREMTRGFVARHRLARKREIGRESLEKPLWDASNLVNHVLC